jgi:hypothetical protein
MVPESTAQIHKSKDLILPDQEFTFSEYCRMTFTIAIEQKFAEYNTLPHTLIQEIINKEGRSYNDCNAKRKKETFLNLHIPKQR